MATDSLSNDRNFMELAIEEMAKSTHGRLKVGAVLVVNGGVVGQAHRTSDRHAERSAIEQAQTMKIVLKGSTIYTTLEPCVTFAGKRESCSELIANAGVSTVVIGQYDPNPNVNRMGWRKLRDAGICLRDFHADLRARIASMHTSFTDHFAIGYGPSGSAKFDYMLNDGIFEFRYSKHDGRSIIARWAMIGRAAIQASALAPAKIAVPRYAEEFGDVDDPTAHQFSSGWERIEGGGLAVFANDDWSVIVKVIEVENGPEGRKWGDPTPATSVKIKWEVREIRLP